MNCESAMAGRGVWRTAARGAVLALVLAAAALAAGGCGRAEFSGFLTPYTGFQSMSRFDPNLEYVQPGVRWGAYTKVRIAQVLTYVQPRGGYRPVDPDELKWLADYFEAQLMQALGCRFELTADAGPGVLDVRAAITRLRPTNRAANAAAWLTPGSLAVTAGYTAVTNSNLVLGEAGVEVELADSLTRVRRYAFVGMHLGSGLELEQVTRWGIAMKALRDWADLVAARVEALDPDHDGP
ncbi:MAG: DUF3313 domain-containing protein [Planctomycetes bacterium]|nr:DUF3313 domain-containing protein [Planctomycetota bacterium]